MVSGPIVTALALHSTEEIIPSKKEMKMIEFQSEGRTEMQYLTLPKSGTGPEMLVLHSWWGLRDG